MGYQASLPRLNPSPTPAPTDHLNRWPISKEEASSVNPNDNSGQAQSTGATDGTFALIILLFVAFCFIWSPRTIRWYGRNLRERRRHLLPYAAALRAEERLTRATTEGDGMGSLGAVLPHGMSLKDRRDFVNNVLVTKVSDILRFFLFGLTC